MSQRAEIDVPAKDVLAVKLYLPADALVGYGAYSLFKTLRSVDLPHPDGPIIAVIRFAGTSMETSNWACWSP
jgi:hypothetical protein